MTGVRRRMRVAVVVAAVALLAGCVGIPTSGPIRQGDVVVTEPGSAFPLPADPVPDADPVRIVEGFLSAGQAGLSDDFVTARKFLTLNASAQWDPRAKVLVYPAGAPEITRRADGSLLVVVPLEARIDAAGVYTEAAPGAREELVFEMLQDSSRQWRISSLDDGVVMSAANFENQYRPMALYFASADLTQLVPDLRWFPIAKDVTSAVTELLAGPADWLRDAVRTGVPEGARLNTAAVPVTADHVAVVDLAAEANLSGAQDRALLQTQLEATLGRLPRSLVTDVQVAVGGLPWEQVEALHPARDVAPASGPYVLSGRRLAVVEAGAVRPLPDVAPLDDLDARDPAVSLDETVRVVLDGRRRLMLLPSGAAPAELLTGRHLVAPSIDRFDWVWTGEVDSDGVLLAVPGAPGRSDRVAEVAADWLDGRTVRSLRVARDGSRVAIVSAGESEPRVTVDVAGVVRDGDGVPQRLGEPWRVGMSLTTASEVAWVDETTLAVLGLSGDMSVPATHVVQVGGPTTPRPLVDGTTAIAAGRGERALYLVDAEGTLRSLQVGSWVVVAEDVRDPVFPG